MAWALPHIRVEPDHIRNRDRIIYVLEVDGVIVGYYDVRDARPELPGGDLDKLFVEPTAMRMGYGKQLLLHAIEQSRERGLPAMQIRSEPNAKGFYAQMGAEHVSNRPVPDCPIENWVLPVFNVTIDQPETT
jgi:GNAT superfamily N-acetyltransferase